MIDLDAIRKRAEAATPGPWASYEGGNFVHITLSDYEKRFKRSHDLGYTSGGLFAAMLPHAPSRQTRQRFNKDAEFIAHAREDVPNLVAEVKRLRGLLVRCLDVVNADAEEVLVADIQAALSGPGVLK